MECGVITSSSMGEGINALHVVVTIIVFYRSVGKLCPMGMVRILTFSVSGSSSGS